MKYALVVNKVTSDINLNVELILEFIKEAKSNGAEFIIFPESAITGFDNRDIPEHDFKLAFSENSNIIQSICKSAKENQIYISLGFFEEDNNSIYDSTICIDDSGEIICKYRRMTKGWHGNEADKEIYKEGEEIKTFYIKNKKYGYLICGDLFDDKLVHKIREENIDILVFPFARSFYNGHVSQERWDVEEMPSYIEQITKCNALTLMTNYIEHSKSTEYYYFGGAYAVDKLGKVIAKKEIGSEGILYADI